MLELDFLALFLAGLLGGGHCVGMCGGVVAAFSLQLPKGPRWHYHLGFNLGRLLGYCLIGMLAGLLGSLSVLLSLQGVKSGLFILANLLLILLGSYMAGWSSLILLLEKAGRPLWLKIQPYMRLFLPIKRWPDTLIVGALWGWLPCGLVYTASLNALASASPWSGGLIMLSFGLGTLPNLLLMSAFAEQLRKLFKNKYLRYLFGGGLMFLGAYRLIQFMF
ncbi:sulfite exporter TauE/SafE family protein [Janthinobacterium sp. B9-8]|uniref:sulfite exporter TauE/SafE family protein n=1 Tax=Janthinobacterium sp. B9-8 TaxID=1236179 RepID=UPI00061CEC77|nr:sulfite exporter TauE/SafE family protein [Janthinobacterium sp. B9-8]AMC34348.1 hypothetical protein VN23_06905 [Janthinobacterium sp. B9-8]